MKDMKWAPYRQEDRRWRDCEMWNREKVIGVAKEYEGMTSGDAGNLLFKFENGNNIGPEGCLLCSLAMVIKLLYTDEPSDPVDPAILNEKAREWRYYTSSGLSMVPIYSDLVRDFTDGQVQLCAKEEYPYARELKDNKFEPFLPSDSYLLRGYRSLPRAERDRYAAMLKIGTYDDKFASHYLVVDPREGGKAEDDDFDVLDPYQPEGKAKKQWLLSDAYRRMRDDEDVGPALRNEKINGNVIQGVWIFAAWKTEDRRMLMDSLAVSCVVQTLSKDGVE